ncbi:DNA topoisomerase I [Anoxybacter fermentans]|uniref:DNA topoisomerase 1 n=1 Tax=Anoxybacter fermentans TaxID=1323375 RepID=A0A3S9SVN4_9FIRM|nr:type I DNA topoisomerase [Anoxybacter fermentans]AZR72361.1 DNA topoisomerase I [Anoxybacter fermentans]
MPDKLVIVESPAKAKTIRKFLGKEFRVEASMGHVIDLPKSQLGVDIENNFKPKYITIRGKGKILNSLKKAAKKSKEVYLATDPDREGEAISWHLARALKLDTDKPCRIEFNEITKKAVQNAIKSPRVIDQHRVDAQQARRVLDRLVGYKLSPLLWNKVRKGLSAGRVQSVAVRIICDREREIEAFVPEEYWTIDAQLSDKNETFVARLYRIDNKKFKISNEKEAKEHETLLKKEKFIVEEVKEMERKRNPYPPFTTSSLQQAASNFLGFSTKKTMFVAQQLYEGLDLPQGTVGLITYIRTDSTRISDEAQVAARKYIEKKFGSKYLPEKKRYYRAREGAQDAHEAIRPTDVFLEPDSIQKYLTPDQYKLYKLIWERFVASQMSPAINKIFTIDIKAGKYLFRLTGTTTIFQGFQIIDSFGSKKKDQELPELKKGDILNLIKIIPEQHFTQPPARYTEASLVKTLEEKGIGRPSTYAPIVATIQQRGYVVKDGKTLKPTELGFIVTDLLTEHFPDVIDVEFTAMLEDQLDKVEDGSVDWVKVIKDFYKTFEQRLEQARKEMENVELESEVTDVICEKCGRNMVVKHGRYGKFLACPGYPECKNTQPYIIKTGVKCIECEDGELIERRTKKGRIFYGCSNYPECEFITWNKPVKEKCPECGAFLIEKQTKKNKYYQCVRKECGYKQKEGVKNDQD